MSVRHVGSLLIGLTVALFAANAEVRACTTDAECDDGNVCISDHCDPATGACSYQNNGSCTVNPKTVGYWTRVCRGTWISKWRLRPWPQLNKPSNQPLPTPRRLLITLAVLPSLEKSKV